MWRFHSTSKTSVFSVLIAELVGGQLQGNRSISSTPALQSSAGKLPSLCSERGEARHFDINVSDVDVARNLWKVHILHGRDSTSGCRWEPSLLKQKKHNMGNIFHYQLRNEVMKTMKCDENRWGQGDENSNQPLSDNFWLWWVSYTIYYRLVTRLGNVQ